MPFTDSLKRILKGQKELLVNLEKEISDLDGSDLVAENQGLKEKLTQTKNKLNQEEEKNTSLSSENVQIKNALYEQIYNEKMTLLRVVNKRLDLYFESQTQKGLNRLKAFEKKTSQQIEEMVSTLKKNRISAEDEVYKQLEDFKLQINQKVTRAQNEFAAHSGAFSSNQKAEFDSLSQEQVSEYELKGVLKKNNIESLIGLNIMSKVGILFLIIAVIALSRYGYLNLSAEMKGVVIFAIGAMLLGIGEWLNRKMATIFSIALTSGGIGILYVATSLSFFTLKIIEFPPALLLFILITFLALVLSLRYNAQTITIFALIGGFLPVVTIAEDPRLPFIIMAYFLLLNISLLLIATKKKWIVSAYVGFFLNVSATIFVMKVMLFDRANSQPFGQNDLITILYILLVFLIYTLIPMISAYKNKLRFRDSDIFLIGINTLISAVLMNTAFVTAGLRNFMGLLAIMFAFAYLSLGRWMEHKMPDEKLMLKLFYLTGFVFVVLVVPYQFKKMYVSLGWLVEGVVLATYGILRKEKDIKWGGIVISLLCLLAFLFVDLAGYIISDETAYLFSFKYFAITLGSLVILSSFAIKKTLQGTFVKIFKYIATVNVWIFSIYMIQVEWGNYLYQSIAKTSFDPKYLIASLCIVLTFLMAYLIPRIKALTDYRMKLISVILYFVGILWLFVVNSIYSPVPFTSGKTPMVILVAGTIILVFVGLLSVLSVMEIVRAFVVEQQMSLEWYPMLISTYMVVILTQNLITQYGFEFQDLVISLVYLVTALLWILYGFRNKYAMIRRFGLGLSILAITKLIFLDLSGLSDMYRIVSYFVFGILLLLISLVYQHFNKRLELKAEVTPNEKKDNL